MNKGKKWSLHNCTLIKSLVNGCTFSTDSYYDQFNLWYSVSKHQRQFLSTWCFVLDATQKRMQNMIRQKEMDGGQLMSRAWREQQIVSSPVIMFSSFRTIVEMKSHPTCIHIEIIFVSIFFCSTNSLRTFRLFSISSKSNIYNCKRF